MDECEALCNRLTIMVRGEMQCLGNITYLKQRYGQGFTLMIKLREGDVDQLKERIRREFLNQVEIKDEHKVFKILFDCYLTICVLYKEISHDSQKYSAFFCTGSCGDPEAPEESGQLATSQELVTLSRTPCIIRYSL